MSTINTSELNTSIEQFGEDMNLVHAWTHGNAGATVALGGVATPTIRNLVSSLLNAGGAIAYKTKAQLDADLNHAENSLAFVTNDSTATNLGWYIKVGASGEGSWQQSTYDRTVTQGQLELCLRGSGGYFVDAENFEEILGVTDLDDLYDNRMFAFTTSTIAGLANMPPVGAPGGYLLLSMSIRNIANGTVQMAIQPSGRTYIRANWGSGWTEWAGLAMQSDVASFQGQINLCMKGSGGTFVNASNFADVLGVTDLDDLHDNRMFVFATSTISGLANMPPARDAGGYLFLSLSGRLTENGTIQMAIQPTGKIYVRGCWNTQYTWTEWSELAGSSSAASVDSSLEGTFGIFQKVVCCGDSFTSGHIHTDAGGVVYTNENYAWPHYLSLMTGQTYINCGKSGANAITWQTEARGLPAAQSAGKAQAYIVGLGLNDSGYTGITVDLGTSSDIGSESATYYAQYSKIIRELHEISPLAHIFVLTMPGASSTGETYNQAIRTIASAYSSTYKVHLVDIARDYGASFSLPQVAADKNHAHYTAIGYKIFANILLQALSDYVNDHVAAFADVYTIPTA